MKNSRAWLVLFLVVLIGMPLLEVWLLIRAGSWMGVLPTVGLLLGIAALGGWLARHEGTRAWRAIVETSGRGEVPTREMADGALVLVGAVLLVLPGFLSDVVGLFCLLPFTRPLPRMLMNRIVGGSGAAIVRTTRRHDPAVVIPGEVVEEPTDRGHHGSGPDEGTTPPALEGRVL